MVVPETSSVPPARRGGLQPLWAGQVDLAEQPLPPDVIAAPKAEWRSVISNGRGRKEGCWVPYPGAGVV